MNGPTLSVGAASAPADQHRPGHVLAGPHRPCPGLGGRCRLSGAWIVAPGLAGTVPAAGLAYAAVGGGLAAVGAGLTVTAYSSRTGALAWQDTLTGFPAGAAIVSVRAWPGEVTVGVSYRPAAGNGKQHPGAARRTEVVLSG